MLKIARPVDILPHRVHTFDVEGSGPVTVEIGSSDSRLFVRAEGPGLAEFVFLSVHPATFMALSRAMSEIVIESAAATPEPA